MYRRIFVNVYVHLVVTGSYLSVMILSAFFLFVSINDVDVRQACVFEIYH